ncbi:MAG TPA: AAA family ATPase, partial [Acidobacteriota bacterium]|nr:AAA family ATPase [Acidobacteriota bacterium]
MIAAQRQIKEGMIAGLHYHIGKLITIDKTGEVYACRDLSGKNSGLVIRIAPSLNDKPECMEYASHALSLMKRLRHPNLVRTIDFGLMDGAGEIFLVEERLNGTDVYSATEGVSTMEILFMTVEMLKGLGCLHARGIVHGGVNPFNVIVCDGNREHRRQRVKLTGLNLRCRLDGTPLSGKSDALSYTAPEVLSGGRATVCSDLYATGIILYELLTRRLPFKDEDTGFLTQKLLQGSVDMHPVEALEGGTSIAGVLSGLINKNPSERIASAHEAILSLGKIMGRDSYDADEKEIECHFSAARLVGREKEIAFLCERAEMVKERGRGRIVFITGEAGSGKSRVMDEFGSRAVFNGLRVVETACGACEDSSYSPYRQVLNNIPSSKGAAIFQFDTVPQIAEADPFDSLSGFAAGQFHDLLVRELFRRLSSCPTILMLHDFHWADRPTSMVLDYLCADIQAFPVLICVSLRPGENKKGNVFSIIEQATVSEHVEVITLEPLTRENIEQMIAGMTGEVSLRASLSNWLFRTVGGNPFSLEEMLKHLVEQSVLKRESGKWLFMEDKAKKLETPTGVGMILKKRLSNLSLQARSLVDWLSLFRRAVAIETLCRAMSAGYGETADTLRELHQRQMVKIETANNKQIVEFNHELIAEVIRGELPERQAQMMHRRIAEVIERESGSDVHVHELAMHHMEGKTGEPSIRYALASAARSRAEFSHENALRCYDYVFSHRNCLPGEELCAAAIDASDTMFALGMADNAIALLKKILNKSRGIETELRAGIHMQLALAFQHSGNLKMQEDSCKKGLAILNGRRDVRAGMTRAMLLAELAFCAVMQSRPLKGVRYLEKALEACPDHNATALKGRIQNLFASLFCIACKFQEALKAAERATAILASSGESYLSCSSYSTLGVVLMRMSRFKLAFLNHQKAVELSEKNRSVILRSQALGNLAECLCRMGRVSEALNAVEQAVKSVSGVKNPVISQALDTILAEAKLAAGDYGGARRILMDMEWDVVPTSSLFTFGHACFVAADLHFALGDFAGALKYVELLRRHERAEAPFYERELAEAIEARIFARRGSAQKALAILISLDKEVARKRWPYHRCIIQIHMAEIHIEQNMRQQAERYAKNAVRLALAMDSAVLTSRARLLMGLACSPARRPFVHQENSDSWMVSDGSGRLPAGRAIEELRLSMKTGEASGLAETVWRAAAELSMIHSFLGDRSLSAEYAGKAYEYLCKCEDQIPSEMLPVFLGAYERSGVKLDLVRLIDAGGLKGAGRKKGIGSEGDEENTRILLRLSSTVNSFNELKPLLKSILDQLLPVIGASRAWVFLYDDGTKSLSPAVGRNALRETLSAPDGVCGRIMETVCKEGKPI